ncbi:MAG: ketopantoate reductase family protein [Pseudomonadota bacterium]
MEITVVGAGALGGYFGGRLATAGHDVTLVARGAHLEALQSGGLRVESALGDMHLPKIRAVATPAEAGRADAVFLMVKNRDLEAAAEASLPLMGPSTVAMTVQNGVSAPTRAAAILGAERVIGAAVYMPADIKAPGVIRHASRFHRVQIGTGPGGPAEACAALAGAMGEAGLEVRHVSDIDALLWEKFVLLAPFSAITALTRLDMGPIRRCPPSWALMRAAVEEAAAVGHAECPTLAPDIAARQIAFMGGDMPEGAHASMQDDLVRGKPLELDWLSGEIVRLGARHGIPTPVHAMARAALAPFADGAP